MDELNENVTIDWKWVEAHLTARERLERISEGSTREAVLKELKTALEMAKSLAAPKSLFIKKGIRTTRSGNCSWRRKTRPRRRRLSRCSATSTVPRGASTWPRRSITARWKPRPAPNNRSSCALISAQLTKLPATCAGRSNCMKVSCRKRSISAPSCRREKV